MRKYSLSLLFVGTALSAQTEQKIVSGEPSHEARVVAYSRRTIADISSQIHTEVAIVLPDKEKVIAVSCGDTENWPTMWSPVSNVVVVKPAKQGSTTSINIQSDHGNVYTFSLREVSQMREAHADLKIYIEPGDAATKESLDAATKYVDAKLAESWKRDAQIAHAEVEATRKQAEDALIRAKSETEAKYPTQMKFGYNFDHGKKAPFPVDAIWHDDRFTYISGSFSEPPAVYETKDGTPALIDYQYENGVYVLRKIVEQGTLRVGKKQMAFAAKQG